MSRKQLDVKALYEALDLVRVHTGMTWRDVAAATGISPSTLTRIGQGRKPDADALVTLLAWLRVPADRFTTDTREDDSSGRADPLCVWPDGVCTCGEPEGHQGREDA